MSKDLYHKVWNEIVASLQSKGVNPAWLRPTHDGSMWAVPYAIIAGSHCYGTSTPESDYDVRGIALPPRDALFSFSEKFDQLVLSEPHDLVLFDLKKFFQLASQCNPNIIEILFAPEECVIRCHAAGDMLRNNATMFLSRRARHTFSGYAASQLKRIETHRKWLMNPPTTEPTRAMYGVDMVRVSTEDYNLVQSVVQKQVDEWSLDLDGIDEATRIDIIQQMAKAVESIHLGLMIRSDRRFFPGPGASNREIQEESAFAHATSKLPTEFLRLFDKERKYRQAKRDWDNYQKWLKERNPARAALEARYGIDTKHAAHLVRLSRMAYEIITTGQVIVKRPDAEELLDIRNGGWSYELIVEHAQELEAKTAEAEAKSPLPKAPDIKKLDALCAQILKSFS